MSILTILDGQRGSPLAHYRFCGYSNHQRAMTAKASSDQEEIDGQVRDYEDDIATGAANWIAGVSGQIASSETQFPLVEMELARMFSSQKEEESTFDALFKNRLSRKNGYRTCDYIDRKGRNVAMAIIQILQPHRTSYMALAGTPIQRARILWKGTRQHAVEEKGGGRLITFPILDLFLSIDGLSDGGGKETISLAVLDESGEVCEGRRG
ncbi:hypothetical protein AXG93_3052s1180 [Marchantia polymorpha subsp. ruderalis]|uniref:Uncharacterized protein n=1 Tax=Marchantia polymorpha subsp. ruderalis TaxID=1480154 RepID=A0A176WI34_MARPO|nr:hypothetical protein AXG93_3052s1180 [Marchantia polymorpha subsp. ruderalis]